MLATPFDEEQDVHHRHGAGDGVAHRPMARA